MNNTKEQILKRIDNFTSELGVPNTAFVRNVGISVTTYYKWRKGSLALSNATMQRISDYLSKYNF